MTGVVAWITGLPASGKTTLARAAIDALRRRAVPACVLDSDEVRAAAFPDLGYAPRDRDAFYRALGELAALLAHQGLVVIVAATANLRAYRRAARARAPAFIEVYVDTGAEECARRDVKGLYDGPDATHLPGRGATYEAPERPDLVACGGHDTATLTSLVELCATRCSG